jgi:hypothetical protein
MNAIIGQSMSRLGWPRRVRCTTNTPNGSPAALRTCSGSNELARYRLSQVNTDAPCPKCARGAAIGRCTRDGDLPGEAVDRLR